MTRKILGIIVLPILLIAAIAALIFVILLSRDEIRDATGIQRTQAQALQTFDTGGAAMQVRVINEVGKVNIIGRADTNQITVGAVKIIHVVGTDEKDFDRLSYRVSQDGNTINVVGEQLYGTNVRVEITVTVPKNVSAEVRTNVGTISLTNLENPNATYKLESDVGAIKVNNVGAAMLNLRTDVGEIELDNITAGMIASTDTGQIRVKNATLLSSHISSDVGRIEISGTFNLTNDGIVKTDLGEIVLRMPADKIPRLEVSVGLGRITNNLQIVGIVQADNRHLVFGNTGAKLTVTTGNGSVSLYRL